MIEADYKRNFFHQLAESAFIAFLFGILDLLFFRSLSSFSLEEIFLNRFGYLSTSIAVYLLLLYILLGIGIGVFSSIIQRIVRIFSFNLGKRFHVFFNTALLSIVLIGLRLKTSDSLSSFIKHYAWFFLIVVVFCISLGLFPVFSRNIFILRTKTKKGGFAVFGATVVCIALILMIPFLSDLSLKYRFRSEKIKANRPNIILIVMDTVRADSLSCYQPEKETTPNIDSVAQEGTLFLNAVSPSPWTLPSHASMFTGLYPSQHEADWRNMYLDEEYLTLAEHLSEFGYQTVGLTENPWVSKNRGLAQGFKDFYELYVYPRSAVIPRVIDKARSILFDYRETREYAADTVRVFKSWIYKNYNKRSSKPFFAFLNLMPAHLPNYSRPQFMFSNPSREDLEKIEPVNQIPERFYLPQFGLNEKELRLMHSLYEGDVAYLDSKLGELFYFLKDSGVLENTVLILTSDHGENFGDHNLIEHQFCLYNSLLHVPLIIRYPPKIELGTENHDLVSTIFLFQTIVDLAGVPKNKNLRHIEDRSLLQSNADDFIYAEYDNPLNMIKGVIGDEAPDDFNFEPFDKYLKCIYGSAYKFIWSSDGKSELFSLKEDWQEKQNLFSSEELEAKQMYQQLRAWYEALWIPGWSKKAKKIDKKTEEALKSLGYIKK
jgi:arylsulfatase A-like enzyme